MFDKMKQLMELQKKMQEVKRQLDATEIEAKSTDGKIAVVINGSQVVRSVSLNEPGLGDDARKALEDRIKDALNSAVKRSQELAAKKMQEVSGLGLPKI